MTQIMVRYRVKPDRVAENEQLVRAVYNELRDLQPSGFRYVTFRLEDGVTFIHLASTESDDGGSPLQGLDALQRFQETLAQRCDEPPVLSQVGQVGSYRAFGDDR